MARQRADLTLLLRVPDPDRVVRRSGGDELSIATEHEFRNAAAVSFQRANLTAARDVPKLHLADSLNLEILHHVGGIRLFRTFRTFLRTTTHRAAHHRG